MTGQHLTDEEFAGLLSGEGGLDASHHVLDCAPCRRELRRVQASLDDFASRSLEWAEQRAARSISTPSALLRDWQSTSAFTAIAASVLAAAALFVAPGVQRTPPAQTAAMAGSPVADSDSQVASDNILLMSIDREIRWQPEAAISALDFATPERRSGARLSARLTN